MVLRRKKEKLLCVPLVSVSIAVASRWSYLVIAPPPNFEVSTRIKLLPWARDREAARHSSDSALSRQSDRGDALDEILVCFMGNNIINIVRPITKFQFTAWVKVFIGNNLYHGKCTKSNKTRIPFYHSTTGCVNCSFFPRYQQVVWLSIVMNYFDVFDCFWRAWQVARQNKLSQPWRDDIQPAINNQIWQESC